MCFDITSQLEQEFFDNGYAEGQRDLIKELLGDGVIIENVEKYLNKKVDDFRI